MTFELTLGRRAYVALAALLLLAGHAPGQVRIEPTKPVEQPRLSWREIFAEDSARSYASIRNERPIVDPERRCQAAIDAPDSVAIFGRSQEPIISIYGASMFASSRTARDWNIKNLKRMSDTLRVRIVDAECDKPGSRVNTLYLIGEVDGYYVRIPATAAFQTVTFIDTPSFGWGYLKAAGGGYEKGMVQEACAESKCTWRVRSAQSFRDSVAADAGTNAAIEEKAALSAARKRAAAIRAKGWSKKITDDVIAERVAIGMTAEMVRMSWGDPEKVNTTLTASGRSEQWVYRGNYVYLKNGVVTAIQESRAKPRY